MRQALIFSGTDQWGGRGAAPTAAAMTGLSELLGVSPRQPDPAAEAAVRSRPRRARRRRGRRLQLQGRTAKSICTALWHTLIADADRASASGLANQLGSLLLGTLQSMPENG